MQAKEADGHHVERLIVLVNQNFFIAPSFPLVVGVDHGNICRVVIVIALTEVFGIDIQNDAVLSLNKGTLSGARDSVVGFGKQNLPSDGFHRDFS